MAPPTRRAALTALAGAALAGCSGLSPDGHRAEETSPDLSWLKWVPDGDFTHALDGFHLDVTDAVREFPDEVVSEIGVAEVEAEYNVDRSEMKEFITLRDADSDQQPIILTGSFDPDAILSDSGVSEEQRESAGRYEIAKLRGQTVGISTSGLVIARTPEYYIDARSGRNIASDVNPFTRTIDRVVSNTFSSILSGDELPQESSLSSEPVWCGVGISAREDGTAASEHHLHFRTTSDATQVLAEQEPELTEAIVGSESETVDDIYRDEQYIVASLTSENYRLEGPLFPF